VSSKGDPLGDSSQSGRRRLKPLTGQEPPQLDEARPLKDDAVPPADGPLKRNVEESRASARPAPYGSRQLPPRDRYTVHGSAGYVRFQVHVEDGVATIVDSHFVDGELALPGALYSDHVYEVTDGARLLHADSLPDLGVQRGFANPSGPLEQRRHHVYTLDSFDFDVRVPAEEVTPSRRQSVAVVLYRAKERPPARELRRDVPLGPQFSRELREVARVDGITDDALPEQLRS
jgi:hypothetical protein